MHLFFRMKILKDSEEDGSNFLVSLAVHHIIPIGVFDLLLADFGVRLRHTFLQLEEVFIKFLAHRVVAYGVDYAFKQSKGLRALVKRFDVLHVQGVDST